MTEEDLAAIEARLEAATPGPWTVGGESDEQPYPDIDIYGDGYTIAEVIGGFPGVRPNAALIAHAPEDLAALLAEVRRLQALNAAIVHDRMQEPGPMGDALALAAEQGRLESLRWALKDKRPMKRGLSWWWANRSLREHGVPPEVFDLLEGRKAVVNGHYGEWEGCWQDTKETALADLEQAIARLARQGLPGSA